MSVNESLLQRSGSSCELCATVDGLSVLDVSAAENADENAADDSSVVVCEACSQQIADPSTIDTNHWRCLNDSMWSEVPAVQVTAWRMLTCLSGEAWARDLLDTLYLEDDVLSWAKASSIGGDQAEVMRHVDFNGAVLEQGDAVTLVKDLDVKGANFTAKRGTSVRNISLVQENAEHIEGRVNGQQIVILTKFVKKNK
jgi:protein PhnA